MRHKSIADRLLTVIAALKKRNARAVLASLAIVCGFSIPPTLSHAAEFATSESESNPVAADPAKFFPSTALVYVHIQDPLALVNLGKDDRIWNELKRIGDIKRDLESKQFQQFKQAVELIESRLGASWTEIVDGVSGGGIHLCFEPLRQAVLVIVEAKDGSQLTTLNQELLSLQKAGNNEAAKPVEKQLRGVQGWSLGPQAFHCVVDNLLFFSNKEAAINQMLDRRFGKAVGTSLADARDYQEGQSAGGEKTLWGFARLGPLRIFGQFNQAINGLSDNPLAELVAGGILDVVGKAGHTVFTADVVESDLHVRVSLPFSESDVSDRRRWYFSGRDTAAQPLLEPPGTILSLSTYRDFSQFWLSRDELFEEVTLAEFSQADTNLGTFFSGMEFGRDVLGSLEPGMRLVVARQNFAEHQPKPTAKFPAVATIIEMKDPDAFFPQLLATYQTIVGVINLNGAMNAQPKLLLGTEDHGGVQIWKSTYLPDPNTKLDSAPVIFNLSPSCVRVDNHFVISSTTELARQIVDELRSGGDSAATADNTRLLADFSPLSEVLAENKAALVAQNMLEEGISQEESDEQVGVLISLLKRMDPAALRFAAEDHQLIFEFSLGLKD
ncbi:MAG: hypothetical protein MPJ50_16735 [Pirellulales bacterium]|nr:hypothetical protein [Pirellulales bacterium]